MQSNGYNQSKSNPMYFRMYSKGKYDRDHSKFGCSGSRNSLFGYSLSIKSKFSNSQSRIEEESKRAKANMNGVSYVE